MKNLTSTVTFTLAILLSLSIGKYSSKMLVSKKDELKKNVPQFDASLRNFHPNKGE